MRPAIRAAFAALAFLAAAPLAAQEAPPISPLRVESDHNGVNIIDGRIMMPAPVLSVPAAPRLQYDRAGNAAPLARGHTYSDLHSSWSIHTGTGKSEMFDCDSVDAGQVCTSAVGTGSFFRPGTHVYKPAGTGEVWTFNYQVTHSYGTNGTVEAYVASTVVYSDGERINYTYEGAYLDGTTALTFRPTRLDDNLGYYIKLTYQPGEPGSVGWNTVATAALYATSNPTTPIQQFTYSGDAITQIGSDGASRTSACTGCTLPLGVSDLEVTSGTTTLPGEATPMLQVDRAGTDLVSTVVRDGVTWTYTYTNLRVGRTGTYIYDKVTVDGPNFYHQVYDIAVYEGSRNVITAITDSLNRKTKIDFDPAYQPTRMVFPELNEVSVLYDVKGNIYSKTTKAKPGSGLADLVETASYPLATCANTVRCFRPDWSRDALGRQTDYVWNLAGELEEQTDPADARGVRKKTYIEYDAAPSGFNRRKVVRVCGDPSTGGGGANPCGTANEIRTEYDYSDGTALPSVERHIDAAAGVTLATTYAYDAAGHPLVVDGPLPGTDDAAYFHYDGWGRKTWEIGPKGSNGLRTARRYTYRDSDDKVIAVEEGTVPDPNGTILTPLTRTDTAYDAHRNPVREAVSADQTIYGLVERSFDDRGRLVCQAQRMNMALFGSVTDACQLAQPEGSQGPDRITHNIYDAAGQLLQVQRAYATPLQQNYATYEYTLNGRQKAVIDADRNRAEMTYDGFDRQRRWIFPSPTPPAPGQAGVANPTDYEEYGYDAAGNRTSLRKRDGVTLTYQYDDLNRLRIKTVPTSATGAAGYSVYYGYDVRGLQAWARFGSDSGPGIATQYDGFGRVGAAATSVDGTARTLTSTYDVASNRIGLSGDPAAWGYVSAFGYDAAGRLTGLIENGHPIADLHYDPAGRRSSLGLGFDAFPSSAAYTYDAVGRLQGLTHHLAGNGNDQALTFDYNPASQIVTRAGSNAAYASNTALAVDRTYSVNGLNQYTGTTSGGTPSATFTYDANGNLTGDGANAYVYDAENRLVSASGGHTATLSYDPLGRLWQVAAPNGTTRFLYDGDRLAIEYDAAGTVLRAYDHGTGSDEPLVWYEAVPGGVSRRYLHADHEGSIIAVADQNGSPIAINAYDEWGIPNSGNIGRFGYTGQAWLSELGMWYYKARLYSPTLGRFLQTDPVGYKDQVNLYAYVGNDPVDGRDPTGLETYDCLSGVGKGNCSRGTVLKDGDFVKTRYGEFVIGHGDGFTIATPIASGQSQLNQSQLTNVVFNETKSLRGDRVDWGRRDAAHVIANGDANPGPLGRPVHASAAVTAEETRSQVYNDTARAVRRTMAERSLGFDPTSGARHFNIRTDEGTGPWRGLPMVTHEGPLGNSYTKGDVPASSGVYLNTYGGPTDW